MEEKMPYDELLQQYKRFQIEVDVVNQALYDCRRQVKTNETLEAEYQEEIKTLQAELESEREKWEARVQQQEETNLGVRNTYNERVNCLEKELSNKDDEIRDLKRELGETARITEAREATLDDKLLEEFSHLKEHNTELSELVAELEKIVETKNKENAALQDQIKHFEEELSNYKEILEGKREEVREANTLIQTLKDDLLCAQSELESVKNRPLDDQSRGNSLFAEVDDRRLQLQENMKEMKTKYIEMRRQHSTLLKQVTTLRNENTALMAQWKAEIEGTRFDEELILETYKNQIQTLNELLESYQTELKQKTNSEDPSKQGIQFLDKMLAMKNSEIESLRDKLSMKSLNHTSLSYDLVEANRQLRKHNLEILELKNEIGQLKTQIEENEIKSPTETVPVTEATASKSIVKNSHLEDGNKENGPTNKRVQFTETTLETNVTDRNKLRKGVKILTAKPIKYS